MEPNIPKTLDEAHLWLENNLPPVDLGFVDGAQEYDMIQWHFNIGRWIRNNWGFWADSPLKIHLQELGFTHPDDMSQTIIETFWCKRHNQEFRLKERVEEYAKFNAEK
jgi:hypothetical protein